MFQLRLLAVALLGVLGSGCITTLTIKKDEVSALKKVALIGYAGHFNLDDGNANKNSITATIGAAKGMADLTSGKQTARRQEQAMQGYAEFTKQFSQAFGFEFLDRQAFTASPQYTQTVDKSRPGGEQFIPGVLSQPQVNFFKPADLAGMAQAMGVDALVTVDLRYDIGARGGVSIGGMGSTTKSPIGNAHLKVTNAKGEIIWEDYVARGQVTTQGLRNTMGADIVENETAVMTEAATTTIAALLERYKTYVPPPPPAAAK